MTGAVAVSAPLTTPSKESQDSQRSHKPHSLKGLTYTPSAQSTEGTLRKASRVGRMLLTSLEEFAPVLCIIHHDVRHS